MSPEIRLPRPGRRFAMIAVIVSAVVLIGTVVSIKATSRPKFCRSCHFMETYYDSWARSTHNETACIKCHYPPGIKGVVARQYRAVIGMAMFITGRYSDEPRAEVSDANCLADGCHAGQLVNDEVIYRGVAFSHDRHLTDETRGKHLRCTSCHSQIVQGDHMTVTENSCFLCHFKRTANNGSLSGGPSCHAAPPDPVQYRGIRFTHADVLGKGADCQMCHVSVVEGDGVVPQERCYTCHDKPERIAQYEVSDLLHENHVTKHAIDCLQCHLRIKHQKKEIFEALSIDCQKCHPDHHAAQKELYMGVGGKNVGSQPDVMFLARVSCPGCHVVHGGDEVQGVTEEATAKSCAICHGEGYAHMEEQWKQGLQRLLQQIEPSTKIVADELARLGPNVPAEAQELFRNASHNIELVSYGRGVHNIQYSQRLLLQANADLVRALEFARSSRSLPPIQPVKYESGCKTCHFGIETKALDVYGKRFEHDSHLLDANLSCGACHSSQPKGQPGHGETPITAAQCMQCHHQTDQVSCATCHEVLPAVLAYSNSSFDHRVHVEKAKLTCTKCHSTDAQRSFFGNCSSCHHDASVIDVEGRCTSCHRAQTAMFKGDSYQRPSVKYDMELECVDCHAGDAGGIERAQPERCLFCHTEDDGYATVTAAIQQRTQERMIQIDTTWGKVRALLKAIESPEISAKLDAIVKDVTFVRQDRSNGLHNPELTDQLLSAAQNQLDQLLREITDEIQR